MSFRPLPTAWQEAGAGAANYIFAGSVDWPWAGGAGPRAS